jgi:hypothetical protein
MANVDIRRAVVASSSEPVTSDDIRKLRHEAMVAPPHSLWFRVVWRDGWARPSRRCCECDRYVPYWNSMAGMADGKCLPCWRREVAR